MTTIQKIGKGLWSPQNTILKSFSIPTRKKRLSQKGILFCFSSWARTSDPLIKRKRGIKKACGLCRLIEKATNKITLFNCSVGISY
jgi:hypothetical protein